ncbi:hypothetical protein [Paenibacillus odorifer]|uniref:hypothetical protein n=1 Tax=Paenibacillus odorifer TaxID=189426 RepID=UPI00398A6C13
MTHIEIQGGVNEIRHARRKQRGNPEYPFNFICMLTKVFMKNNMTNKPSIIL